MVRGGCGGTHVCETKSYAAGVKKLESAVRTASPVSTLLSTRVLRTVLAEASKGSECAEQDAPRVVTMRLDGSVGALQKPKLVLVMLARFERRNSARPFPA